MFVVANIKRKNEKNNIKTKKNYLFFEGGFGTELASIGTGNEETKKPEGISFGRTTNKYDYGLR